MRELKVPARDLGEIGAAVLAQNGRFQFRARGHSMHPAVRDGDVLVVEPVDVERLTAGEIILCRTHPLRLVAHRLIAKRAGPNGPVLVIRGDACKGPGEEIEHGCVLGRVVSRKRRNRVARIALRLIRVLQIRPFLDN